MKQITGGAMRFKKTIHLNGCLLVVSLFLIALLFIPIAGNAGPLATVVITSVPALGTPPTIAVGQSVVFTAEGKDAEGNTVPIPDPGWYSDGVHGTIEVDPNDPNKCTYTATSEGADYIQCCDGKPGTGKHGSDDFTTKPPCSVEGKVEPSKAKADGCTVTPESQTCACGIEEIEFTATAVEGWEFHEWIPSNKLQCPDSGTAVTTGRFASVLTLAGQSREFLCANDENRTVTVLPFSLTASTADDWGVSLFAFNASGEGDDKKDIAQVTFNYPGGSKTGTFDADDGTITFSIGEVLIPAGSTKSFSLVYEFAEMEECCSDCKDFNVAVGQHNALPVASPGHKHGSANGTAIVGCIWNENQEEGYETIQEAVDGASSGDTIMVCPGTYEENVDVNKSLTIKSFGSCLDTTVQAADANDHVFEVTASDTIIDGLTIQNATGNGKAGIHVSAGDCNILDSIIQNNGGAGIVVMKCEGELVLENVKIRNNKGTAGDGIGIISGDVTIRGAGNEIINNGGDGVISHTGNVTITGTGTEIHDNGGWGITAEGNVVIHEGALMSVNKNGKGGIIAANEVSVPPNFEVADNGGPGITSGCNLFLENIKARNNKGEGVGCIESITISGTSNEIINNGGDGVISYEGDVTITGTGTEIHDNGGWGITAEGNVVIHEGALMSVNKNGKGGIIAANEVSVPPNFEVADNGGPGITSGCNLFLENIKARNNKGEGVGCIESITISGTSNEIINNGGDGVISYEGDVTITGTGTEIHDNGGWGITAEGNVVIHEGALMSVNKNGKGGIIAANEVSVPPNFEVADNGGPGITSGCNLFLENIKARNNKGEGVGCIESITISGTSNEIINNGGDGVISYEGDVTITGTGTEIHDNGGWGIRADEGLVEICDGVNISGNGQGDIYCPGS